MEKTIRYLSTFVTSLLIYAIAAYAYLSFKGFAFYNGKFTLVQEVQAQPAQPSQLATPLDDNLAINFKSEANGNNDAPLTMYELSSLGCTHCADFHLNILPKLQTDFIDNGKLKTVFVNFPLDRKSMQAAMLAECLPAKNRHNFLNLVFSEQRKWGLSFDAEKVLKSYALANGLNKTAAEECLKNDKLAQEIMFNREEGIEKLKMQGTPAFLISGNGKNEIIYGVPDYEELKAYLENRLN